MNEKPRKFRWLASVVVTVAVVANAVGGSAASFPHRISIGAAPVPAEINVIVKACVSAWAWLAQIRSPAAATARAPASVAFASAQVSPVSASEPSVDLT